MKITKLLILVVAFFAAQSVFALEIEIINEGGQVSGVKDGQVVHVDPVWKSNKRGWTKLTADSPAKFNCMLYTLRGLFVHYPEGKCLYYNFELNNLNLKGLGKVQIKVNSPQLFMGNNNWYPNLEKRNITVDGYVIQGSNISCDGVKFFN